MTKVQIVYSGLIEAKKNLADTANWLEQIVKDGEQLLRKDDIIGILTYGEGVESEYVRIYNAITELRSPKIK